MTNLHLLQFYATPEHRCSYLANQQAKTIFVDPKADLDQSSYSELSELGFRRSGNHIYRPHCDTCSACISARVMTAAFHPSKSQKRVINLNNDLEVSSHQPTFSQESYALYERYINSRHQDGDMYPASQDQFETFLVESNQNTRFIEFRLNKKLLAISVIDYLERGISAIYTFFDPEHQHRSLGKYAVLWLIVQARNEELPYLYLGYWIRDCQKMSYKIDYLPIQLLIDGEWLVVQKDDLTALKAENILRRT
ncbi:MAG: arginyltransferase [Motiliproteus sp.]